MNSHHVKKRHEAIEKRPGMSRLGHLSMNIWTIHTFLIFVLKLRTRLFLDHRLLLVVRELFEKVLGQEA